MCRFIEKGLGSGRTEANNEVYLLFEVRNRNQLLLPKPAESGAWQNLGARIWWSHLRKISCKSIDESPQWRQTCSEEKEGGGA